MLNLIKINATILYKPSSIDYNPIGHVSKLRQANSKKIDQSTTIPVLTKNQRRFKDNTEREQRMKACSSIAQKYYL